MTAELDYDFAFEVRDPILEVGEVSVLLFLVIIVKHRLLGIQLDVSKLSH